MGDPGLLAEESLAARSPTATSEEAGEVDSSPDGIGGTTRPTAGAVTSSPGPASAEPAHVAIDVPASGRGFDEQHIYLGVPTAKDFASAMTAFGVDSSFNWGDQEAVVNAIVDDINARGGVFGRTIVPVFHDNKASELVSNPQVAAQANCVDFTEDRPVLAVLNVIISLETTETLVSCLAKRQTPLVSSVYLLTDDAFQQQYDPFLYRLTVPSFDRLLPVWLDRLSALGYFGAWDTGTGSPGSAASPVRIGLLHGSDEPSRRAWSRLKSALEERGHEVAAEFQFDSSSLQAIASSVPQAVLPFRSAGVTHVFPDRASSLVGFARGAENQRYRPRYGLYSLQMLARVSQGESPPGQLAGSMGVGWVPSADVDAERDPGVGPGLDRCRDVLTRASARPEQRNPEAAAYELCDGINLVVRAALAGGGLHPTAIRDGVSQLGQSFESAVVFRSAWSTTRSDQPGALRDVGWDDECACFGYLSDEDVAL